MGVLLIGGRPRGFPLAIALLRHAEETTFGPFLLFFFCLKKRASSPQKPPLEEGVIAD